MEQNLFFPSCNLGGLSFQSKISLQGVDHSLTRRQPVGNTLRRGCVVKGFPMAVRPCRTALPGLVCLQ